MKDDIENQTTDPGREAMVADKKKSYFFRWMTGRSGQVEVETAIVMPAVVFVILGLIQLGMLNQARLIAEYAAYRAVRSGVVKNANIDDMEMAALAASLPVLSRARSGSEVLDKTETPSNWLKKWLKLGFGLGITNRMTDVFMKYTEVKICNPLKGDITEKYSVGGKQFMPFDDPVLAGNKDKTKLVIELTMNYRLVIPFADWVFWRMARGRNLIRELRLQKKQNIVDIGKFDKYRLAAEMGVYILPIRAQYSMKMQSDVALDTFPTDNECVAGGGAGN